MKNLGTYRLAETSNATMNDIVGHEFWLFLTEDKLFAVLSEGEAYSFRTTEIVSHQKNGVKHFCVTRSGSVYVFEKADGPVCTGMADLFRRLYGRFERMYSCGPVQTSRADAFRGARKDHFITLEMFEMAEKLYGDMWSYVGD